MAQRLINALSRGLGKTVSEETKKTVKKATRDIPSTDSFYKLGMGIGPFIRNTVQSYKSNPSQTSSASSSNDKAATKANMAFAKENVVTQKNIAGQLSALTSIMSDIRRISLAQLSLQRQAIGRAGKTSTIKGLYGDRSGYLSQEQALESGSVGKGSITGTNVRDADRPGLLSTFAMNNPGITGGVLGLLGMAFKNDIKDVLKQSGLGPLVEEMFDSAAKNFTKIFTDALDETLNNFYKNLSGLVEKLLSGKARETIEAGTKVVSPFGGIAGGILGAKIGSKLGWAGGIVGGIAGGLLGQEGVQEIGDLIRDATTPDPALKDDPAAQQKKMEEAQARLAKLGITAGAGGAAYYGGKKIFDKMFPKSPPVTPTTPPSTTMPPPGNMGGREGGNPKWARIREQQARFTAQAFEAAKAAGESTPQKSLLSRVGGALGEFAEKTKALVTRCYALLEKLIAKIGIKRVVAYISARLGLAASGFIGGPAVIVTTVLAWGWMIYDLYLLLEGFLKEVEGVTSNPMGDVDGTSRPEAGPGPTPTQPPAGSLPPTGAGAGRGKQGAPDALQSKSLGNYASPTQSGTFTSEFGMRKDPFTGEMKHHAGFDYKAEEGEPVFAMMDGEVTTAEENYVPNQGLGRHIIVKHADGTLTKYGHLSRLSVKVGAKVKQGEKIGEVGNTGRSKGAHLHVEIHRNGVAIDPRASKTSDSNTSSSPSQTNASGTQSTAPGAPSAGSAMARVFGFDPSNMGIDLKQVLSGEQLAALNAMQNDLNNLAGSQSMNMAPPSSSNGPSNPNPPPATPATVESTVSKEKDFLWYYYNPMAPAYG